MLHYEVVIRHHLKGEIMGDIKREKLQSLVVLVLTVFGMSSCNSENIEKQEIISNKKSEIENKVVRPFPNIPVDFEEFAINASRDNEIVTNNGSILRVPSKSLIDANGNIIKGKVNIKYKEYRDMVDVFLSGITMQYDSGGEGMHFESAGMFEIRGEDSNGSEVFVKEGKELIVDFASENSADRFNLYAFDETASKWNYLGKDKTLDPIEGKRKTSFAEEEMKKSGIKLELEKNEKSGTIPKKADETEFKLRVVFDEKEYPELAVYEDLQFQILNKKDFNPEDASIDWISVNINKKENGQYSLHFVGAETERRIDCIPVLEGENYDKAMKQFESERLESKAVLSKLEEVQKQKELAYQNEFQEWEKTRQQDSIRRSLMSESDKSKALVMREFQVKNFGIYNSDCPRAFPKEKILFVQLKDKDVEKPDSLLQHKYTYLVDKSKNALYTYYNTEKFGFNPEERNLLWTITKDNKLAVLKPQGFEAIGKIRNGSKTIVEVEVIDIDFKNEKEIRSYLEI